MRRYCAWLAYERGDLFSALGLQLSAFGRGPKYATADLRNWLLLAAILSAYLLPRPLHAKVSRLGTWFFRCVRCRTRLTEQIERDERAAIFRES